MAFILYTQCLVLWVFNVAFNNSSAISRHSQSLCVEGPTEHVFGEIRPTFVLGNLNTWRNIWQIIANYKNEELCPRCKGLFIPNKHTYILALYLHEKLQPK